MLDWTQLIQAVCDKELLDTLGENETKETIEPQQNLDNEEVLALSRLVGNNICADCGQPDTTWASTNLGVFVCIQCCGAHRRMGTNISKIKSITLDKWEFSSLTNLKSIGNVKANEVWEANLGDFRKPVPESSLENKANFIKAKYENRNFLDESRINEICLPDIAPKKVERKVSLPQGLEELKSAILELLQEDEDFRKQLRILIYGDLSNIGSHHSNQSGHASGSKSDNSFGGSPCSSPRTANESPQLRKQNELNPKRNENTSEEKAKVKNINPDRVPPWRQKKRYP